MIKGLMSVIGFLKIFNPISNEIFFEGNNGINFENFSQAIAQSLTSGPLNISTAPGFFYSLGFGNGGTSVSATGVITYNPPNTIGSTATLYNQTYSKVINNNFSADADTINNNLVVNHVIGKAYSDILLSCQLDFNEPADQQAFDNTVDFNDQYVFDELGIFSNSGQLLTHVIFSPIQKSLNRLIQINYTVRIQTLSSLINS